MLFGKKNSLQNENKPLLSRPETQTVNADTAPLVHAMLVETEAALRSLKNDQYLITQISHVKLMPALGIPEIEKVNKLEAEVNKIKNLPLGQRNKVQALFTAIKSHVGLFNQYANLSDMSHKCDEIKENIRQSCTQLEKLISKMPTLLQEKEVTLNETKAYWESQTKSNLEASKVAIKK